MYISEFGYREGQTDIDTWTVVATEDYSDEYGCGYYEDCPCCTCDDETVVMLTLVRPRYSKSQKRIVEDSRREFSCSAHVAEFAG